MIKIAWDKLKAAKAYNKAHPELTPQQKNDNLSNAQAEAGKEPDFIDWLLSGIRLQVMEFFSRLPPTTRGRDTAARGATAGTTAG